LKAIVAQFDAAELITQREAVSNRIRTDLLRRAQEFNIALEDVSITHMTFGREFTRAVEQKQIAQQDAERARFIVEKPSLQISSVELSQRLVMVSSRSDELKQAATSPRR
jgi:regulator of protease activity HflC (stomatin/prohibitin superfamily)